MLAIFDQIYTSQIKKNSFKGSIVLPPIYIWLECNIVVQNWDHANDKWKTE